MANEFKKECGVGMYWCNTDKKCKPIQEANAAAIAAATAIAKKKSGNYDEKGFRKTLYKNLNSPNIKTNAERRKEMQEDARIPREAGQPAKSDKHSDLYTDEDPKGTIHGLKFASKEDAEASVRKIKSSGRSHAHKIQAAIAMEQRARVMGKSSAAAVYRSFINDMKDKTKDMRESWSDKYKKSINCSNPKGFSQKAHCQGRKKRMKEDAPVNAVGGGQVAGLGVGPQGEPGISKKKKLTSFISFIRRK